MKNPPFTPGPWEWGRERASGVLYGKDHHVVGEMTHARKADKRLIGAAADLFDALERAAVALGGMEQGAPIQRDKLREIIAAADAALLKAGWK